MVQIVILTRLIRRAKEDRRVIIQGMDIPYRGLITGVAGLLPAIPLLALLWPTFRSWSLLSLLVTEAAAFALVNARTRGGVRLWRGFVDRQRARRGLPTLAGQPVKVEVVGAPRTAIDTLLLLRPQNSASDPSPSSSG